MGDLYTSIHFGAIYQINYLDSKCLMTTGTRKAKHDIAPMIRNAFVEGIGKVARDKGITIPDLMAEWITEDWKAVLNAMGKYTVRENTVSGKVEHDHNHDHTHTHEAVSETSGWIEGLLGNDQTEPTKESVSH